jgi:hypothetical protein
VSGYYMAILIVLNYGFEQVVETFFFFYQTMLSAFKTIVQPIPLFFRTECLVYLLSQESNRKNIISHISQFMSVSIVTDCYLRAQ